MTYLDASVVLAYLFGEARQPPTGLWAETLVTSRLTQYEVWTRIHAHGLASVLGEATRLVLHRLALLELTPNVLARALEPFPEPVRTLDALHLASLEFLRSQEPRLRLAAYDPRLLQAAFTLGIEPYPL